MMFYKYLTFILLASNLIVLSECQQNSCIAGQACNSVKDCYCGDQCVDTSDLKLCHSSNCQCYQGCVVGEIFIPPGISRPDTYCNTCSCPRGRSDGIPECTKRAWCNFPCYMQEYQKNPAC